MNESMYVGVPTLKTQVIWIDAKHCQMAFHSVLVHLPEILEEKLFGSPGQMVTNAI